MTRFGETDASRLFFKEVAFVYMQSGLTAYRISENAGKSHGWLGVHLHYKRPWSAETLNAFCRGVNASDATRRTLHRLAAEALGYAL